MSFPNQKLFQRLSTFLYGCLLLLFTLLGFSVFYLPKVGSENSTDSIQVFIAPDTNFNHVWTAPSDWRLMYLDSSERDLVKYGRELIAHTSE